MDAANSSIVVASSGDHRLYNDGRGPSVSYSHDLNQWSLNSWGGENSQADHERSVSRETLGNIFTLGVAAQGKAAIARYYGQIDDDQFATIVGGNAIGQGTFALLPVPKTALGTWGKES